MFYNKPIDTSNFIVYDDMIIFNERAWKPGRRNVLFIFGSSQEEVEDHYDKYLMLASKRFIKGIKNVEDYEAIYDTYTQYIYSEFHNPEYIHYEENIGVDTPIIVIDKALAKEYSKMIYQLYDNAIPDLTFNDLFNNTYQHFKNRDMEANMEGYQPMLDLLDSAFHNQSPATEAATYSKEKKYPIYIVTVSNDTWIAKAIKGASHTKYSHALISLDISLAPMYSFGRKKLEVSDVGFAISSPGDPVYKEWKNSYSLFVMFVTKENYIKMEERLNFFLARKDDLKYDYLSLALIWLKIPSETSKKYFCSRFVADIIKTGQPLPKAASLYLPQDLAELDMISLVDQGDDISKYDVNKAKRSLAKIKKETRID